MQKGGRIPSARSILSQLPWVELGLQRTLLVGDNPTINAESAFIVATNAGV